MDFGQLILDFDGKRITGENPFLRTEDLAALSSQLEEAAHHFPQGGAIGFFSYEAAQKWEPRAFHRCVQDADLPLFRLVFYEKLDFAPIPHNFHRTPHLQSLPDDGALEKAYCEQVETIKSFIAAGDIYQANLTRRFELKSQISPAQMYENLRSFGQVPRGALLQWDDISIVSNSPETFLTLRNGEIKSRPVKGTIRRGATPEDDEEQKNALRNSAKDRAENVMIVDLLRNDLGRVCQFGSIEVPKLCEIETFPTLHHLVSTVRGQIRPDCSPLQAFQVCFPCGSITGAPKIRAMQILSELESSPRGVAMGAIGYFAFNGDMEWSVAIRTVTFHKNRVRWHVGGGIVADSQPQSEYQEMRLKARALFSALRCD